MTEPTATVAAPAPTVVLNSPTLVLAESKRGKSSLCATAAEYVWETYGLISNYYSTDGGGFPSQMQALINVGIVRVWRLRTRSGAGLVIETCQRASQGWWPAKIHPLTGEVEPMVKLVPPVTVQVVGYCPEGHRTYAWPNVASIPQLVTCPTCKKQIPKTALVTKVESQRTKGFEKVGAALFDGLSSMSDWMMDDLAARSGRNELGGEKGAIASIVSGDTVFGGNNRASYGFVQARCQQMVTNSMAIPGLVIPAVWTALVKEGTDEGGLSVSGPAVAGNAATAVATSWFGNALEAVIVQKDGKQYRRLNLQPYTDAKGIRHLCGVRSYPGMIPSILEDLDEGEATKAPFQNFSLAMVHKLLDQARAQVEAQYTAKYANAPGVSGEMVFGEPETAASAPKPVAAPPAVAAKPVAGVAPRPAVVAPPVVTKPPAPAAAGPVPAVPSAPIPAAAKPAATAPVQPPRPAQPPVAAKPVASPATPMATGPTPAQPPAPKPPMKGPVAPPPGVKPVD